MSGKERIRSYGVITIGTFLMAVGVNVIYEPMGMVTGGFSGIGIILYRFFKLPLWLTTAVLNIPLFILAGKSIGMAFVKKSLYAAICFSVALGIVPTPSAVFDDYLMAAILGGTLNGVGIGMVFGKGASTGGSDLLSTLLSLIFPWVTAGTLLSVTDGIIVAAGMLVFGIRKGLYAIVAVFITTKLMDRILEGLKFAKLLYIISDEQEAIAAGVMQELDRGVTALTGRGMYSQKEKNVLMCAVSRKEAVSVIRIIKKADRSAFIIISDAREVMGEGFTDQY